MDPRTQRDIQHRLQALERRTVTVRLGVITATAPLSVALGGSDTAHTNVKAIAGASLAAGDTVAAITFGNDLLILGSIA